MNCIADDCEEDAEKPDCGCCDEKGYWNCYYEGGWDAENTCDICIDFSEWVCHNYDY